jgi:PAP2 superfamily
MNGSPGGLIRIDTLFGLNLYTSSFSASPIVFGAFPSLHAGWATLHALYLHHLLPQARVALCAYVMWVWWATMYLTHHYFVDLIGGSCLAVTVFYIAQRNYLPQVQVDKLFRWHYDSVTKGHYSKVRDISSSRSRANSAATVAAWKMNGSFVDLETGLVQGVPPHSDEDENWEMQDLSPAEEEVEEGRSGTLSPSTEGSSTGLDSIWTMESDGDITTATTVRSDENDVQDDGSLTIRAGPSKKR